MVTCNGKEFEIFIKNDQIQERIKILAKKINVEYKDKKPVFLGILNGVYRFAGDVFNYIDIDCEISFVKIKSYVGTESGKLTTLMGLDTDLKGRDVILLEDIVDTGNTLHAFLPELYSHQPASVKIMTLLTKPAALQHKIPLEFVGFSVPNHFLVGYGLDYDGYGRHYNDLYKIIS